ncbi:unannotated protein [freshwater metagenome]|uniref:Unannotated protein n=1 Tax=freshwater metagenome TaxID=449393 RepID=A0A6J7QKG5_9ZZZZ
MRQECKHFESRTYPSGETVRKCDLDLAPEAPWRCPANCPAFERRMDVGWTYGTMVSPKTPDEPPGLDDGSAAALLDEAEEFLRDVGPQVAAEVRAEQDALDAHRGRSWKRLFRRKP